jgi:flavin prenyltransferase
MKQVKPLVVALSGASGSIYGLRLVKAVSELGIPIALTMSRAATLVIREELGIDVADLCQGNPAGRPKQHAGKATPRPYVAALRRLFDSDVLQNVSFSPEHEMTAPIASGSYPTRGMVVIPTSTTCFSKIANGISESLIERAAECMIKEGRRLVVVPRETPLSAIHLENLLKLARLGVRVVPAIPAFYSGAQKIEELVDFVVGKTLDQLDIDHALFRRWVGSNSNDDVIARQTTK